MIAHKELIAKREIERLAKQVETLKTELAQAIPQKPEPSRLEIAVIVRLKQQLAIAKKGAVK